MLGYLVLGMGVGDVWGKITLESVRGITEVTREGRARVGWGEGGGGGGGNVVEMRMGVDGGRRGVEGWGEGNEKGGQVIMSAGNGDADRDEIEDVSLLSYILCLWGPGVGG